jgi:competence protein ComEC
MPANAIAFVFGVWVLQQQPALPSLSALATLAAAALALALGTGYAEAVPHRRFAGKLSLLQVAACAACCVLGFAWAGLAAQWRLADGLAREAEQQDIRVTGVIASLPQAFDRGLRFDFDIESASTTAAIPGRVALSWYGGYGADVQPPPDMHAGERWSFTVRLHRPHANANPHTFDAEAWMLERGVRAVGSARPGPALLVDSMVWRPGYAIERLREILRERFWDLLPDHRYAGVMIALALGDQNAIPADDWALFARTGVSHLMSISGLHITMLAGLAAALVFGVWRRVPALTLRLPARKAAAAAGALGALAYVLLSGFEVPAQRTLYMLAVVAIALWFDRIGRGARVLGLALFAVTLIDPWAVLAAGFWLSFGAVAIIFYISAGRLRPSAWYVEWGRVQWAVTVGLIPLLLALFQQVSVVSPLANAIAIPVVSFIVAPLSLMGIFLPVAWPLELGHWILEWLMWFLHAMDALPLAVWRQHEPLGWTLPLAMAGVAWMLLPAGFPSRWPGALLLLPMFLLEPARPEEGAASITVLDVGQGLAVVIETRSHTLLYDTGPQYGPDVDAGSRVVTPVLRGTGIARLDTMVVSHNDLDHSGGALSVLGAMPVDLVLSSLAATHPIHARAALHQRCVAGQSWVWDGVAFDMLHPTRADYAAPGKVNDLSCVLRVKTAHGAMLLTGDIEKGAEAEMLESSAPLASTVLVAPHHGSRTSSTPQFIAAVAPAITVFTVGYLNRFGHPRADVVARYVQQGSATMRTDETGAIRFDFGVAGVSVDAYRVTHARYWQGR